jgi:hypothetical protein
MSPPGIRSTLTPAQETFLRILAAHGCRISPEDVAPKIPAELALRAVEELCQFQEQHIAALAAIATEALCTQQPLVFRVPAGGAEDDQPR